MARNSNASQVFEHDNLISGCARLLLGCDIGSENIIAEMKSDSFATKIAS